MTHHRMPNTCQFTNPSSHHTTSHNRCICPGPSLASCKCMLCFHAQMVEYGALGTGKYPHCLFCYTIRRMVVRDWLQLGQSRLQMLRILPIDNSRALSIMISRILPSDSLPAATLNCVSTSSTNLGHSGLLDVPIFSLTGQHNKHGTSYVNMDPRYSLARPLLASFLATPSLP